MIGATVGSYRVLRQIGEGGMGAVYLGEHVMLGRPAAIKILLPTLSHNREMVGRFFNEARATTAIRHPGIVELYDFGFLPDGAAYIAMEMLDGESLASRLRRVGRLPVAMAIDFGRQVAAALHAAHGRGITHRDLKPDNMFLIRDPEIGERVKLLDFGIAKLVTEEGGNRTRTGVVMGTPVYMSPEQCRGTADLDSRADLYSLGCVLYELVTGRPPFVAESAGDIIAHHLYFEPEPVRRHDPSVPEPLEQLIMALLAKEPAKRPASAAEVTAILDGWRSAASASASAMPAMSMAPGMSMPMASVRPSSAPATPAVEGHITTLSGSAGVVGRRTEPTASSAPPNRRWVRGAIGGAVVAAAAVAVVLVTRPSAPTAVAAAAAPPVAVEAFAPRAIEATAPPPEPAPARVAPAVAPTAAAPTEVAAPSPAAATPSPTVATPSPAATTPSPVATPPAALPEPVDQVAATPPAGRVAATSTARATPTHKKPPAVAAAPKPGRTQTKPPDEIAAPRRDEPRPATPPPAPVAAASPSAAKTEPGPAADTAPAQPTASKWGKLMGDKANGANTVYDSLFKLCKAAASSGDCAEARKYAARIADKNIAMYRARVMTDAEIAACLQTK